MNTSPLMLLLVSAVASALWLWSAKHLLRSERFSTEVRYLYALGSFPVVVFSLGAMLMVALRVTPGVFSWIGGVDGNPVHVDLQAILLLPFVLSVPLLLFWLWLVALGQFEDWLLSRRGRRE